MALDLFADPTPDPPPVPVFETSDRPSVDIVAGLLEANGIATWVLGHEDPIHFGIGPSGFWRVCVRPEDEARGRRIDEVFRLAPPEAGAPEGQSLPARTAAGSDTDFPADAALLARDGRRRPVTGSSSPVRDDGGSNRNQ